MKRVKLLYKGQEVGVYDNKKDAQGVVVMRMNESPDVSVFDFGIEYIEFPLTVREAKEVLGTNEKTCFLLSGDGDVFEENCKDLEFVDGQQKPEEVKYVKSFYNEATKRTYKTLKKAKLANEKASVYRCWLLDGEIKGMTALKAYGMQVCTIMNADKRISEAMKSGAVGVGFKDKRMC